MKQIDPSRNRGNRVLGDAQLIQFGQHPTDVFIQRMDHRYVVGGLSIGISGDFLAVVIHEFRFAFDGRMNGVIPQIQIERLFRQSLPVHDLVGFLGEGIRGFWRQFGGGI